MSNPHSLEDWVSHVFDHEVPVNAPEWYFSPEAPKWEGPEDEVVENIIETFERSGELLGRFTDAQLDQGFWYLVGAGVSDFMLALTAPEVPLPRRIAALWSFVPVFEQVMAKRCTPTLSHLDEQPASPLNGACYMWWDILCLVGQPGNPSRCELDAEVLRVLARLLEIPHDACRESALHGINHWQRKYPDLESVVDRFLGDNPNLRPELIQYAQAAKRGYVL